MKTAPYMNMRVLQPSRRKPRAGDLFVCNMLGERWVAGRVVHMDCMLVSGTPGLVGLLYLYRLDVPDPAALRPPIRPDLLISPIAAASHCWREGFFRTTGNYPLAPEERLSRHVFKDRYGSPLWPPFFDEFAETCSPPEPGEYVGDNMVYMPQGIDDLLSDALGIPRIPEAEPDGCEPSETPELEAGDHEVVVLLPDTEGDLDLLDVEQPLEAALKQAGAGEWEGHGYDLERRQWDIRFQGPDPARMSEAMLPVLKKLRLPPGSSLLVGGEKSTRIDV